MRPPFNRNFAVGRCGYCQLDRDRHFRADVARKRGRVNADNFGKLGLGDPQAAQVRAQWVGCVFHDRSLTRSENRVKQIDF